MILHSGKPSPDSFLRPRHKGWRLKEHQPFFIFPPKKSVVAMNELDSLVDTARAAFAQAKTPAELENAKAQ